MQALNVSAISAAENNIAYFMRIPFDCFTIAARLDIFAATRSCSWKVRHSDGRFRSLARTTPSMDIEAGRSHHLRQGRGCLFELLLYFPVAIATIPRRVRRRSYALPIGVEFAQIILSTGLLKQPSIVRARSSWIALTMRS
jgi:hypothetical protein